jgi:hypothetical protein
MSLKRVVDFKMAKNYLAALIIVAIRIWLRGTLMVKYNKPEVSCLRCATASIAIHESLRSPEFGS